MGNGSARVNLWLLAVEIAGVFLVIGLALLQLATAKRQFALRTRRSVLPYPRP
jgi:hypothetical protein